MPLMDVIKFSFKWSEVCIASPWRQRHFKHLWKLSQIIFQFHIDVRWAHPPWLSTEINELIVLSHSNVGIVSSHHKEYPLFLATNSFLWTVCRSTGFHSLPFYKVQYQSGENEVMQYSFKTGILRNIFVEAHCGDFPIHSVSQSAEKRAFLSEWRYLKSSAKKMGWYCSRRVALLVKA